MHSFFNLYRLPIPLSPCFVLKSIKRMSAGDIRFKRLSYFVVPNALNEDGSYGFEDAAFTFLRVVRYLESLKILFALDPYEIG